MLFTYDEITYALVSCELIGFIMTVYFNFDVVSQNKVHKINNILWCKLWGSTNDIGTQSWILFKNFYVYYCEDSLRLRLNNVIFREQYQTVYM